MGLVAGSYFFQFRLNSGVTIDELLTGLSRFEVCRHMRKHLKRTLIDV